MKILGLIPARGGSKGIPNKNRKELLGKPLLQYTIEAALNSELLDRVIFSSEDAKLIEIAKSSGVDVPFVRPMHLAEDSSGSLEVVRHAVQTLSEKGEHFDAVCLLQVTNPFRTADFIDRAIAKFKKAGTDSLLSVMAVPHEFNPHWVYEVSDKGHLQLASGEKEIIKRRQDLPAAFFRDGSIYITRTDIVMKKHSLYGESISYLESDSEEYVNIDTPEDWDRAVAMAQKLEQ